MTDANKMKFEENGQRIDPNEHHFEQIVRRIDPRSKLLRTLSLQGGVSAQVTLLEVLLSDASEATNSSEAQTKKMVVRQHGAADLKLNPQVAGNEYKLLHFLRSQGLPVPTPYYFDESCEIFPTPYVVIEFIEGQTEFAPAQLNDFIQQVTTNLATIHRVNLNHDHKDLSFLPNQNHLVTNRLANRPTTLDDSLMEGLIRDTLESAWPVPQSNPSTLLHGDFWPGNLLWHEGKLSGVIDWENAAIGDPLADLANARLEFLWAFGIDAMNELTALYQTLMPTLNFTTLPYWDLYAALRPASKLSTWGLDANTEHTMCTRHHWFVLRAFHAIKSLPPTQK